MSRSTDVAKEIMSYCTSCKMDLNHVIVAMKGDRAAKVQCLTCKKEHAYRIPKGITEPPAKKTPSRRKTKDKAGSGEVVSIQVEWEKLMASHLESPVKSYSTKAQFNIGDKLSHPSFGEGIVGKLIFPNKLEVIFRDYMKTLIHAGPPQGWASLETKV
ncbi:MAG: hypothetical protein AABZ06_15015 [Bdellovibrionota bacterium]